jgi:NAD(P)-dependent dehydrogenase (short-subunit alcohol dehydrogenase family)
VRALVYGASGGLARSLITALEARDWQVESATRETGRYSDYTPKAEADAVFLPQALFVKKPTSAMTDAEIEDSVTVGLTDIIRTLRNLLAADTDRERRVDYAVIGSTSAYAGFANTAVYCAVKHGLLGLVRALNDEHAGTGKRFWLFSMGTMDTEMGRLLTDQEPTSFLSPDAVAERIVTAIAAADNLFEPEVIIRRRTVRFKEA